MEISTSNVFGWITPCTSYRFAPVILAADGVHGTVCITANDSWDLKKSDIIQIDLRGWFCSSVQNAQNLGVDRLGGCKESNEEVLRMSTRRPSNVSIKSQSTNKSHSFPFDFDILSDHNVHNDEPDSLWSPLPSSLWIRQTVIIGKSHRFADVKADVHYNIRAAVMRNNQVVASKVFPIIIYDGGTVSPPLCISDFASEYALENRAVMRRGLMTRNAYVLVASTQPLAFEFDKDHDTAFSQVQLIFSMQILNGEMPEERLLDATNAEIFWRLRTSTFLSHEALNRIPTVDDAKGSQVIHTATVGPVQSVKTHILKWQRSQPASIFWEATKAVWLALPKRLLNAPTFNTPQLVRRYSIDMTLRLRGVGRAEIVLKMPCQIVYRPIRAETVGSEIDINRLSCLGLDLDVDPDSELNVDSQLPEYSP